MNRRSLVAALIVLASGPAWGQADDPLAPVRAGYAHQAAEAKKRTGSPAWFAPHRNRYFSRRMVALLAADERQVAGGGEMGAIGADPFLNGQDGAVRGLTIKLVSRTEDRAVAHAAFRNLGQAQRVEFEVVRDGGAWLIDDIVNVVDGQRHSLRKALSDEYPDA